MKKIFVMLFLVATGIFAQAKDSTIATAPDSTLYQYLFNQYQNQLVTVQQKEQSLLANYTYIPVVMDLKGEVDKLNKLIELYNEEVKKYNEAKKKFDAEKEK